MGKKTVEPIPVMFAYEDKRGPWQLGYIHPDDLTKLAYFYYSDTYKEPAAVNLTDREVEVYEMDNGIPAIPKYIVTLDNFEAPAWTPSWNWDVYCERRSKANGNREKNG